MKSGITFQQYDNKILSGYIYKTFSIYKNGVIDILITKNNISYKRESFLKQSGKSLNINERINLKII